MRAVSRASSPFRREVVALVALLAFTLLAVAGYGWYGLNPDRLPSSPAALRFFTVSFQFFAQLHIVLAAVALGVVLVGRLGTRWIGALAAVYVLSFTAEHVGTGYGVPFGGYGYTGLLGWKLGGRVPALIPLSWFLMALPAWVVARALLGSGRGARVLRVLVGALWLVAWDLALDPAMSWLTAYWRWEETGPYYGMPWLNLVGWYVTGLALLGALELLADRAGLHDLPARWMAAYYAVVALMPLGMLVTAGAWLGVGVALTGMAVCVALSLAAGAATAPDDSGAPAAAGSAP